MLRAWEDKPEAARYALMLRAEDLPLGKPTELSMPVRAPSAVISAVRYNTTVQLVVFFLSDVP